MILLVGVSELVSVILFFGLFRKKLNIFFKVLFGLVLLIPFLGPVMYLFALSDPVEPYSAVENSRPRGENTHNWIGLKPIWRNIIRSKKSKSKSKGQSNLKSKGQSN